MTTALDPLTLALLREHDARIRADLAEEIAQAIEALRETGDAGVRTAVRQRPHYAIHMAATTAREHGAS